MNLRNFNIDKTWTLFLDRDGVINRKIDNDYVRQWKDFEFLPGVFDAMKMVNPLFATILVVTNQQGIGKGVFTENDLNFTHGCMQDIIEQNGGRIDEIYFCPALAADNNPCRKPNTGMGLQAKKDFPAIDFNKSIIVGDSITDMQFGKSLGMKTVYISAKNPLSADEHALVDMQVNSLKQFADYISVSK
jgi:D-glycero-D-manno-heptose 1,7-bisphosphate phosphatase